MGPSWFAVPYTASNRLESCLQASCSWELLRSHIQQKRKLVNHSKIPWSNSWEVFSSAFVSHRVFPLSVFRLPLGFKGSAHKPTMCLLVPSGCNPPVMPKPTREQPLPSSYQLLYLLLFPSKNYLNAAQNLNPNPSQPCSSLATGWKRPGKRQRQQTAKGRTRSPSPTRKGASPKMSRSVATLEWRYFRA